MNAVQVLVLNGQVDWKVASEDLWDLDSIELDGSEKLVGHRKIDGSIYKILKTVDGKLIAIIK